MVVFFLLYIYDYQETLGFDTGLLAEEFGQNHPGELPGCELRNPQQGQTLCTSRLAGGLAQLLPYPTRRLGA